MKYKTSGQTELPKDYSNFIYRRVRPLLDHFGTQTRTLEHLMAEAYRQGMADAVEVMTNPDETTDK